MFFSFQIFTPFFFPYILLVCFLFIVVIVVAVGGFGCFSVCLFWFGFSFFVGGGGAAGEVVVVVLGLFSLASKTRISHFNSYCLEFFQSLLFGVLAVTEKADGFFYMVLNDFEF